MADYIYVYNGKRIAPSSGKVLGIKMPPVPEKTLRFKFSNTSFNPVTDTYSNAGISTWHWTPVSPSIGVYDFTYNYTNWVPVLSSGTTIILNDVRDTTNRYPLNRISIVGDVAIIDSNLAGVTSVDYLFHPIRNTLTKVNLKNTSSLTSGYNWGHSGGVGKLTEVYVEDTSNMTTMENMFTGCTALTTVNPLRADSCTTTKSMFSSCKSLSQPVSMSNMTSVTNASGMFQQCTSLKSVPLFDTISAEDVTNMFSGCTAVESGALALYQQMSTQTTPPTNYSNCFTKCGSNTVTGAAELAQIPTSWGGTMA